MNPRENKEKSIVNMWEHKGWGNSIQFIDYESGRISGHLHFRLKVGDEVRSKMESGKIGRFKIIAHRQCHDPSDMFFATVEAIGYVGEPELVKKTESKVKQFLMKLSKTIKGESHVRSISSNK